MGVTVDVDAQRYYVEFTFACTLCYTFSSKLTLRDAEGLAAELLSAGATSVAIQKSQTFQSVHGVPEPQRARKRRKEG
jgi:hypothetical protein